MSRKAINIKRPRRSLTAGWAAVAILFASLSLARGEPAGGGLKQVLAKAGDNAAELQGFLAAAAEQHGPFGARAARGLLEGMPERDARALSKDFLLENLGLALQARAEFPWAARVPEAMFINDVLPYASLDETREPWRAAFYTLARPIVKECTTATEAAQALNRAFFKRIEVHYNTGRKKPNQSPSESRALGMASCTGLSIILVNACRAVGVPARVAGTARWTNKSGNHTWVEIAEGGRWFFTGADEYNEGGLNRAWFVADASHAVAEDWRHAIWASSWQETGSFFPMAWAPRCRDVHGVNVTARYTLMETPEHAEGVPVHVRVFDRVGGERVATRIDVLDARGATTATVTSKAGNADMNDMVSVILTPGLDVQLRLHRPGDSRLVTLNVDAECTRDLYWHDTP